jgi:hypothetical protein
MPMHSRKHADARLSGVLVAQRRHPGFLDYA